MQVKILDQQHPLYDAPRLAQFQALYDGGKAWEDLVSTWLPQHPQEMPDIYKQRLSRAHYEPNAPAVIDLISAGLFSQEPQIGEYEYDWAPTFAENVNGEGTSLALWFRALLTTAMVGQRSYAWVNKPATPEGAIIESLADEQAAGLLDAYLVLLTAEHVIDWGHDQRGRLKWLMARDVLEERADIESGRTRVYRWTYIDAEVIRRWEWTATETKSDPSPEDEVDELDALAHGFGELPVEELCLPAGLHAMGKLHHPAVTHIRASNDLSWALHRGAHPLLAIKDPRAESGSAPILGPGYYASLQHPDADMFYVEPSGASFQLLADQVVARPEGLHPGGPQMAVGADSNATRSKMSGESKTQDWRALETVLSSLAAIIKPALANVLRLVAKAHGISDAKPVIGGLEGWQEEDLQSWLMAVSMALNAAQLSPTFRKEVAKKEARRVLGDADEKVMQAIDAEIDSAPTDDPAPYIGPPMPPPEPEPEP